MEKIIASFLKENNLIIDKPIIVAVSGGADSVSLLYVLYKLGYEVILAHVNHHKRIESEIEEEAMRNFAKELNIPFELLEYHYDGMDNFHNDSHNARYNFFRGLCKKYHTNIIATAHHQDDQIETVLMKIMEGSNLYGYGGIAIVNDDNEYKIIRPLLCVDKEEIYSYVKKNNLVYFEDKSNHEDDFLRNRIRHHVVPLLKKESPSVGEKFEEYSIQAHEAFQFIRGLSKPYLKENNDSLVVDSFNKLDIALKKDIIALMLEKYNIRKNKEIVLNILSLMEDNKGSKTIHLEGEYVFSRSYTIGKIKKEVVNNDISYKMNKDDIIVIGKYKFYFTNSHNNICTKSIKLCYNVLEFPLTIRYKKKGDSINLAVGTKKVSRILIDKKVPKEDRLSIPIIENGNGEILWVYDYAKSDFVSKQKNSGDIYLVCEVLNHDE
jgi:tRNA(Ile)-lysidine synthetase-like protein